MNITGIKIATLNYARACTLATSKLLLTYSLLSGVNFALAEVNDNEIVNKGNQLAFERKKGNCLACHVIKGGTLMGNNGPPLISMKQRFPERSKLIQQISDARVNNPSTIMPPFKAHGILTQQEIELIADWLLTL